MRVRDPERDPGHPQFGRVSPLAGVWRLVGKPIFWSRKFAESRVTRITCVKSMLVWCPANNAKKFRMDFMARQGARRSHSGRYGDDEQRSIAVKDAGII
jgi:hypothetical protein